ncbi:hypothetical protein [Bacillus sp. UNCCL81]|nr:hypothetical protein [Bacillus sp. UNCCL81]
MEERLLPVFTLNRDTFTHTEVGKQVDTKLLRIAELEAELEESERD